MANRVIPDADWPPSIGVYPICPNCENTMIMNRFLDSILEFKPEPRCLEIIEHIEKMERRIFKEFILDGF